MPEAVTPKSSFAISREDFEAIYSALDEAHQSAINLEKLAFGNERALRARQKAEYRDALDRMEKHHKPF
jgi:hypothetical protein